MNSTNSSIFNFYDRLDRSQFIDEKYRNLANYDTPLPIGFEQTISQPSLVLEMTLQLNLNSNCNVLEIGTGSGYQTAFLAEFSKQVFTVELIEELSLKAQNRLNALGYSNIWFKVGDGSQGWEEHAPFDRIMVTAGAVKPPETLFKQLINGGKMIIPIGKQGNQELFLIEKDQGGKVYKTFLAKVRFVELKGSYLCH